MSMGEKIMAAVKYAETNRDRDGLRMAKNDAANIYSSDFEEYMIIWDALEMLVK